ncbi:TonB-dependent receptor [Bdellovibrio bacteriovorus]|uniref:TonB-dependent receptor n=1 Tax=Bdellovibrio bacteriovorus TaxID=959 RepID=UPI0035A6B1D8
MKRIITLLTVFPLILNAQTPANEGTSTEESSTLEAVQVQGTKENKSYQESTESISVVPGRELDSPIQSDSIQALNAVPNVSINKNDDSFSIRGVNNTGVTGFQKDNLSSILVDDVFQTDLAVKAGSFDLWDVQQAEVYRGPQSTTQGVNSLAGSILLFHNKPADQTEGAAKLGYGSFNRIEAGVMTNNVWLDGKLLSRVSVNHEQDDGFIKNIKTDNNKWGKKSKDHLGLDLTYKITETDYVRWNTKIMQNETGGNYVQSANPFDYEVNEDVDFDSKTTNQQTSLRYFVKLNDNWTNEVIGAYSQAKNDETSDADGTANPTAGVRTEEHNDRFVSVENLLKFQNEKVKNVLGFHAHDYYLKDDARFDILYPLSASVYTPIASSQVTDKYRTVFALFDSYLWKFTENQSINLGLRYEFVKNKYGADVSATRKQNLGAGTNAAVDAYLDSVTGSYEDEENNSIVLPKVAYMLTQDQHSYGISYTEGYRTGGLSINRKRVRVDSYDPEKTGNYELSYKYAASNWNFSSAAFYTDWKDQQVMVQLSNDPFDTQVVNAASSELYGAEAEINWKPASRHEFNLGAGYVKTRFKDFVNGSKDYTDNEFPFAPNWTGRLSYGYQISQDWNAAGIFRYLSKSYGNAENTMDSPEQFYLDLLGQYSLAAWSMNVDLYVRNVLDTRYVIYDRTSSIGGQSVSYNQVNSPRELGLRLNYFW